LHAAEAQEERARQALDLARAGTRQERLDQAQARVAQAEAAYDAAQAQLALAQAGTRENQIEMAAAQRREAEAALELAQERRRQAQISEQEAAATRAQLDQAEAAVEAARVGLQKHEVHAPGGGIVDDTYINAGETVQPGSSLVKLVDFGETWLTVYVPEPTLPRLRLGQPVEIAVDGHPRRRFEGTLRFLASEAQFTPKFVQTHEERTRTVFEARVAVDNSEGLLKPGMPADAFFQLLPQE
jgi:HlyD family secretion protein